MESSGVAGPVYYKFFLRNFYLQKKKKLNIGADRRQRRCSALTAASVDWR